MERRKVLGLLAGSGLASVMPPWLGGCAGRPGVRQARAQPNVIFMMTDDQTRDAASIYGNPILRTPNMDRIGHEGIRFNQAFVTSSLCLPSRASFLTGQYPHTHGMLTNGEESGFPDESRLRHQTTWPMLLRAAGYHTGVVGKWHINTPPEGYDFTAVLPGQGVYFDPPMLVNGSMIAHKGHTDDVIGERALQFLRERPRDKPFCMLFQFKAPHRSWEPAARFARAFEDVEIPLPETFFEPESTRPEAVRKAEMRIVDMLDFRERGVPGTLEPGQLARRNHQALVKHYYRVLLGVDENVGRVLEFLDDHGLAEDTIIIYTSDNGFFLGEHGLFDKRLMYEPSIRVPMLLRWPAGIEAGRVDDTHMVLNIDVAPTILGMAGQPVPGAMQGSSWQPLLRDGQADWRHDFLYEYFEFPAAHCVRRHRGVRNARWKLIQFWQQPEEWELYDLRNDPQERRNLAAETDHAAQLARMKARLVALRREYDDIGPPGDIVTRPEPGRCPA